MEKWSYVPIQHRLSRCNNFFKRYLMKWRVKREKESERASERERERERRRKKKEIPSRDIFHTCNEVRRADIRECRRPAWCHIVSFLCANQEILDSFFPFFFFFVFLCFADDARHARDPRPRISRSPTYTHLYTHTQVDRRPIRRIRETKVTNKKKKQGEWEREREKEREREREREKE